MAERLIPTRAAILIVVVGLCVSLLSRSQIVRAQAIGWTPWSCAYDGYVALNDPPGAYINGNGCLSFSYISYPYYLTYGGTGVSATMYAVSEQYTAYDDCNSSYPFNYGGQMSSYQFNTSSTATSPALQAPYQTNCPSYYHEFRMYSTHSAQYTSYTQVLCPGTNCYYGSLVWSGTVGP